MYKKYINTLMEQLMQENTDEAESITLDTCQIDHEIERSQSFTKAGLAQVVLYNPLGNSNLTPENANPNTKYVAKITSHFNYSGILSDTLSREIFGKNEYANKDWYVGFWEKNKKDSLGIYSYNTDSPSLEEFYLGQWVQGKKQGKGMYIWKHSGNKESSLGDYSYHAVIGQFDQDAFKSGIFVKKCLNEKDNSVLHRLYEGEFDSEWKKNGKEVIQIEDDQVFYGEMVNDQMVNGSITTLNKSSEVINSFSFTTTMSEPDKYTFIEHEPQSENKTRAIDIMSRANQLNLFQNIEELYATFSALPLHFAKIETFQVEFRPIFSPLINYLKKDFTLKSA